MEWLWFMLPIAAACGWIAGYRAKKRKVQKGKSSANYYKGLNYLLNHQPDQALDVFLELVEDDSETLDTHLALASLFRQRGEIDKATRIHQNLIARPSLDNYQRGLALLELGRDYLGAGLHDRAENLLLELLEDKQHSMDAMNSLLEIYQKEKDWEKAIHIAHRFNRRDKERANHMIAHFYCEMGEQMMHKGNFMQAVAFAHKAESTEKQGVRAKILQGEIAMKQEKYHDAGQHFIRVLEADPNQLSEIISRIRECIDISGDNKKFLNDIVKWSSRLELTPSAKGFASFLADYASKEEADNYIENQLKQGNITTTLLYEWISFKLHYNDINIEDIELIKQHLASLEAKRSDYNCQRCGYRSHKHYWQCPSCKSWDSIRFEMT